MSDIEVYDCEWRADDGAVGGNAEAIAQKGHDGSAPGRRGGADMTSANDELYFLCKDQEKNKLG